MSNNYCVNVDYLSLSFRPDGLERFAGHSVHQLRRLIEDLLSRYYDGEFHLIRYDKNIYNYQHCYLVKRGSIDGSVQCGFLCYTDSAQKGFNAGLFLSLSGKGCWRVDFQHVMQVLRVFEPKITRVDLAIDYYDGAYSYKEAFRDYKRGLFAGQRGRQPVHNVIERKTPEGEKRGGYTLYIGRNTGNKQACCYEKAYQLMEVGVEHPLNDWFRVEFRVRPDNCTIPLDLFDDYDAFLIGLYPRLIPEHLPYPNALNVEDLTLNNIPLEFDTASFSVSLEHLTHHAKRSYGGLINAFKRLNLPDEEIVNRLTPADSKLPNRLGQLPLLQTSS